jgi:hypothetical protein
MRQPHIWRWVLVATALAIATPGLPALADPVYGKHVRFAGIHPIPKSEGGGMCYIEGPHVHIYAADPVEYRVHDNDNVFVGDPVAYGYEGPKFAYNGPHPIQIDAVVGGPAAVEYCYIDGPHFHPYAPAEGPDFKMVGNAYFFVGEPPRAFIDARPRFVGINDRYRAFQYTRPVVAVEPPHGWVGVRAEFVAPGVVVAPGAAVIGRPGVVVERPGVVVERPGVVVERPGVVVERPGVVVERPGVRAGVEVHGGAVVDVHAHGGVVVHGAPPPPPRGHH